MELHPNHFKMVELEQEYEAIENQLLYFYENQCALQEGTEGELLQRLDQIQNEIAFLAHHKQG